MSDTVYTVKVRILPWRRFTAGIQLILQGYVEMDDILRQAEWKQGEGDYGATCTVHPTAQQGQHP